MHTTIEKRADDALERASATLESVRKYTRPPGDKAIHLSKDRLMFGVCKGEVVAMPDGAPEGMEASHGSDEFSFVMRDGAGDVLRIWRADHFASSSALRDALDVDLAKGQSVTVGRACGVHDDATIYREVAVCTTTHPEAVAKEASDWDIMSPFVSLAGEAGIHGHLLNRTAGRTSDDGAHEHLFMIEREVVDTFTGETVLNGMMLITDRDGAHEHPFGGGDVTTEGEGHTHRIVLSAGMRAMLAQLLGTEKLTGPIGVELVTEGEVEHVHQAQVSATAVDGVHRHVLTLPDGTSVASMNGDDFNALMTLSHGGEVAMRAAKAATEERDATATGDAPDVSDAAPTEGAADVDKQGHVHALPGGDMTGAAEGDGHTHTLPGGGQTGSAQDAEGGHVHSLPDGEVTGPPREPVAGSADDPPADAPTPDVVPDTAPDTAPEGVAKAAERPGRSVRMLKAEDPAEGEERFVFGVVLVPGEVDAQGDTYDAAEVRKAAHGYMQHFGGTLKLMHSGQPVAAARVVETYLTKTEETHGGEAFPVGTWLMGTRIDRSDPGDALWSKVRTGEFTGYSIGGTALREALAPSDGEGV